MKLCGWLGLVAMVVLAGCADNPPTDQATDPTPTVEVSRDEWFGDDDLTGEEETALAEWLDVVRRHLDPADRYLTDPPNFRGGFSAPDGSLSGLSLALTWDGGHAQVHLNVATDEAVLLPLRCGRKDADCRTVEVEGEGEVLLNDTRDGFAKARFVRADGTAVQVSAEPEPEAVKYSDYRLPFDADALVPLVTDPDLQLPA